MTLFLIFLIYAHIKKESKHESHKNLSRIYGQKTPKTTHFTSPPTASGFKNKLFLA